jgi:RHS repeat-associated protein
MHYRHRQYDPRLGRFVSMDPASPAAGGLHRLPMRLNPYVYVENDPQDLIDPSGGCQQAPPLSSGSTGANATHQFSEGVMTIAMSAPRPVSPFNPRATWETNITFDPAPGCCSLIVWVQWIQGGGAWGSDDSNLKYDNEKTGGAEKPPHQYYNYRPPEYRQPGNLSDTYDPGYGQHGRAPSGTGQDGAQYPETEPATLIDYPERPRAAFGNTIWRSCVQCIDERRWMGCVDWFYRGSTNEVGVQGFRDSP